MLITTAIVCKKAYQRRRTRFSIWLKARDKTPEDEDIAPMTSATHGPAPGFTVTLPAPPRLSLRRIVEMNLGFFGLQFSFGLQQANMC